MHQSFEDRLRYLMANQSAETWVITPDMATSMLQHNDRNRPVYTKRVSHYAAQMKSGNWRYTRVPIIFSNRHRMIDGQHRCLGCVDAQVSFECDVVFGAPDDSFYFIDVGKTRGAADIFGIHRVPNYVMAAAATRVLMAYDAEKQNSRDAYEYGFKSLDQVYAAYLSYDRLQDSIRAAGQRFHDNRMPHPSTASAMHYVCAQKNRADADAYFEKVATGLGFSSLKDPAYKVRNYLTRSDRRLRSADVKKALILGWNRIRTNRPLGNIDAALDERVI